MAKSNPSLLIVKSDCMHREVLSYSFKRAVLSRCKDFRKFTIDIFCEIIGINTCIDIRYTFDNSLGSLHKYDLQDINEGN